MTRRHAIRSLLALAATAGPALADTTAFTIVDDPALDAAVAQARAEYLATAFFSRLDATILIEQPDGSWRRGSFNAEALAYPASCVKLAYLVAAMRFSADNALPFNHLDAILDPMIEVSSNFATGQVVDAITGTTNLPQVTSAAHPLWADWYAARLFTENYLDARGLLGNQTIASKTYPTNSGSSPTGAEAVLLNTHGGNRMQPLLSASLMLETVAGAIEADTALVGSTLYMRDLLSSERLGDNSAIGFGVPPGSVYENKIGIAYDTLEDIAHIILPNGQRVILAIYTNGWQPSQPLPYDAAPLGEFAWRLFDAIPGLRDGLPPRVVVDNADPGVTYTGSWLVGSAQPDKLGPSYAYASNGSGANRAEFALAVPQAGVYEVSVRWPAASNRTTRAPVTVTHADGQDTVFVNQEIWGGRWVRVGAYRFEVGGGVVALSDDIPDAGQLVLADAVQAEMHWCPADMTTTGSDSGVPDGVVDISDFSYFLTRWAQGARRADISATGSCGTALRGDGVDISDFSCFLTLWTTGCP